MEGEERGEEHIREETNLGEMSRDRMRAGERRREERG